MLTRLSVRHKQYSIVNTGGLLLDFFIVLKRYSYIKYVVIKLNNNLNVNNIKHKDYIIFNITYDKLC